MSLFEGNYDLEIWMQLIWEFTIYIENKINFYDEQIANDIFFLPVKERVHDILSSRGSFHTLCCYLFLSSCKTKKIKMRKYKKYIYQKIFERNPKNNKSEKRMLERWKMAKNWLRRLKNIRGWNLTVYC